jgi:hypothetical protein
MSTSRPHPSEPHPPEPHRRVRLARNLLALLILYGNAAVALQPPALRHLGLSIPRPSWVHDAFLMTGMFGSYSVTNGDFVLEGRRTQQGTEASRGQWIALRLREHFARRHGVTFTELFAAHHWDVLGREAQREAWAFLARRIRERHNRLHPDLPVDRVRFGSESWPQSRLGYRAGKASGPVSLELWFEEDPR